MIILLVLWLLEVKFILVTPKPMQSAPLLNWTISYLKYTEFFFWLKTINNFFWKCDLTPLFFWPLHLYEK